MLAEIGHDSIGKIIGGLSDSASDEIDNINLAGSDAIADASFENFSNNFFLRAKGINGRGGLATGEPNSFGDEIRWGDVIEGKFAGESGAFLTYVSPTWNGFELSSAVGQARGDLPDQGRQHLAHRQGERCLCRCRAALQQDVERLQDCRRDWRVERHHRGGKRDRGDRGPRFRPVLRGAPRADRPQHRSQLRPPHP